MINPSPFSWKNAKSHGQPMSIYWSTRGHMTRRHVAGGEVKNEHAERPMGLGLGLRTGGGGVRFSNVTPNLKSCIRRKEPSADEHRRDYWTVVN